MLTINRLDHLVLTVADLDASIAFYTQILGCELITFGDNRKALGFGSQKINLHLKDQEIKPNAKNATTGSADLCFIIEGNIQSAYHWLKTQQIELESEIVERTGAAGKIYSVYLRDPDGNLIELSQY